MNEVMEVLVFHPKSKTQSTALKAFAKAFKMDFETIVAERNYTRPYLGMYFVE